MNFKTIYKLLTMKNCCENFVLQIKQLYNNFNVRPLSIFVYKIN